MRPTVFLKNRYREFLRETSDFKTVLYFKFDSSSVDSLTGDIDESTAYPVSGIELPARIIFIPSRAIRDAIGLDIKYEAILCIPYQDLVDNSLSINIGDAFILPNDSNKRYTIKVVPRKQVQSEFIEILIVVSRKNTGRG